MPLVHATEVLDIVDIPVSDMWFNSNPNEHTSTRSEDCWPTFSSAPAVHFKQHDGASIIERRCDEVINFIYSQRR